MSPHRKNADTNILYHMVCIDVLLLPLFSFICYHLSFLHLGKHELDGAATDTRFPDDCFINLMWEPVTDQAELDKVKEINETTDAVFNRVRDMASELRQQKDSEEFTPTQEGADAEMARLEALLGSERGEALCSEGVADELSMADVYDMVTFSLV